MRAKYERYAVAAHERLSLNRDFKILKIRSLVERWCSNELWNWQLHLLIRLWLCSWKLRVGSWHLILHSENYEIFCWDCWQILFKMQRIYQGYACHFMELTVFPLLALYSDMMYRFENMLVNGHLWKWPTGPPLPSWDF